MSKEKLLSAARTLIGNGTPPSRIREADLVATGACAPGQFGAAFADLAAFQRELCSELFAEARVAVLAAAEGKEAGLSQLSAAFIGYLDYNLHYPALQELAHHIQFEQQGWDLLLRMEIGVSMVVQADLGAMGASLRPARARLLTAMVVHLVRAEYAVGRALPDQREALLDYCRRSAG